MEVFMATRIRLTRKGRKHLPVYRVVVADSRSPRDGKFLEQVGFYDPAKPAQEASFEIDAILKWLGTGAIPSERVLSLLKKKGIFQKFEAIKAGKDVSNWELRDHGTKSSRKRRLSPKAIKRAEAAKAEAEAPAAEEEA